MHIQSIHPNPPSDFVRFAEDRVGSLWRWLIRHSSASYSAKRFPTPLLPLLSSAACSYLLNRRQLPLRWDGRLLCRFVAPNSPGRRTTARPSSLPLSR